MIVAVYGEELDPWRQHGVPAGLLDPPGHLVLGTDTSFCVQANVLTFSLSLVNDTYSVGYDIRDFSYFEK